MVIFKPAFPRRLCEKRFVKSGRRYRDPWRPPRDLDDLLEPKPFGLLQSKFKQVIKISRWQPRIPVAPLAFHKAFLAQAPRESGLENDHIL